MMFLLWRLSMKKNERMQYNPFFPVYLYKMFIC